eukprot:scaffold41584_cov88-Cyclotella_meneghiniana.AAC.1
MARKSADAEEIPCVRIVSRSIRGVNFDGRSDNHGAEEPLVDRFAAVALMCDSSFIANATVE